VLSSLPAFGPHLNSYTVDNNLTLQESLYRLRAETKDAFDEAKALEARWKDLEREQKEVYQVRRTSFLISLPRNLSPTSTALYSTIPPYAPAACNNGTR
jgi:hypothetical protein